MKNKVRKKEEVMDNYRIAVMLYKSVVCNMLKYQIECMVGLDGIEGGRVS